MNPFGTAPTPTSLSIWWDPEAPMSGGVLLSTDTRAFRSAAWVDCLQFHRRQRATILGITVRELTGR